MFRYRTIAAAAAIAVFFPSLTFATTITINPDEAASKDTFVYAFRIPDTLGIPGAPNMLNFDTPNIPESSVVPFGDTLGVAETIPFRNNPADATETIREHTTRSLLEFDVSALAGRASDIISATFQITGIGNLFPFDPPSALAPILVNLKPILEGWDEQTVTWDTRPAVGAITSSYLMTDGFETLSFDITDLVKGWASGSILNFGFELSQDAIVTTPPATAGGRDRFAVGLFASSANTDFATPSISIDVAPVPLPAAAWLLLAGIGGLGALRRFGTRAA